MESIINSISKNEVIRKEFKIRFDTLLEKSKKFNMTRSNDLYKFDDLLNDELFKTQSNYESNKQEINELQREILIIEDQIKIFNSDINCLENIRKKLPKLIIKNNNLLDYIYNVRRNTKCK